MYYHLMQSQDIRVNLATEDYMLNQMDFNEPVVLFYIQEPSIIVGKNQNLLDEIDMDYVSKEGIVVTRRLSGGGTVYDDLGNVSFSFVTQEGEDDFGNFKKFTQPILDALTEMGVEGAERTGRNDLAIQGNKFSGNAMYKKRNRLFSHGTLMFDVDLTVLPKVLTVSEEKLKRKGIKSVSSRVTNIKSHLAEKYQTLDTEGFRDELLKHLFKVDNLDQIKDKEIILTEKDYEAIDYLVQAIYSNDEWIYGKSPEYTHRAYKHFPMGTVDVQLTTQNNHLKNIYFLGDYIGQGDSMDLSIALHNKPYDPEVVRSILDDFDLTYYFGPITLDDLLALIFNK